MQRVRAELQQVVDLFCYFHVFMRLQKGVFNQTLQGAFGSFFLF